VEEHAEIPLPDPHSHGQAQQDLRTCPTRPDGAEPLVVHSIGATLCALRQGTRYHKCWSCEHREGGMPVAAVPPAGQAEFVLHPVPPPQEVETPARVSLRAI
jgi:hypothetical protein